MAWGGGKNRRKHARVWPRSSEPIEIQIMGSGFLDVVYARDLSIGGVSIWVPHDFSGSNLEREVELVVKLPRTGSFVARGIIRHRLVQVEAAIPGVRKPKPPPGSAHYFGVEFIALSDAAKTRIETYVAAQVAGGYEDEAAV